MNSVNKFNGLPEFAYATQDRPDEVESKLDRE
jgi:hypothetical protein